MMVLSETLTLRVAHTWDGKPVPDMEHVTFEISATSDDLWVRVEAPFHADPAPPGKPGPTDGLWNYEVAELFVVGPGDSDDVRYTELELSPHGHFLLLLLHGVRNVVDKLIPLRYSAKICGNRWSAEALLPRRYLPPSPHRINAFAIHGTGASRRYLAMTPVPGSSPDFHRLEAFQAIDLPL